MQSLGNYKENVLHGHTFSMWKLFLLKVEVNWQKFTSSQSNSEKCIHIHLYRQRSIYPSNVPQAIPFNNNTLGFI